MSTIKLAHKNIDAITLFKVLGLSLAILVHVFYGTQHFELLKFQKLWVSMQYGIQLIFLFGGYYIFKEGKKNSFNLRSLFKGTLYLYIAYIFLLAYYIWENTITGRMIFPSLNEAIVPVFLNLTMLHSVIPSISNGIVPGTWIASCFLLFSILLYLLNNKIASFERCLLFLVIALLMRFLLVEILIPVNADSYAINVSYFAYANFLNQLPVFILGVICYHWKQSSLKISALVTSSTYILVVLGLVQIAFGKAVFFPTHIEFALLFVILFLVATPHFILNNRFITTILQLFKAPTLIIYYCHFPMIFLLQKIGLFDMVTSVYISLILNYIFTIIMTLVFAKFITFLITIIYPSCISLEA